MTNCRWLLKAASIEAMEGQTKVHYLNPKGVRINKSLGDAVGMQHMGFHLVTVMPGRDSTEYHMHYYEEECIYVLSGCGAALIDEQWYAVGAGDFLGFPASEAAHALTNNGSEPLVLLVSGLRLEHDVCDYPHKGKRLYIEGENRDLVDISAITQAVKVPYRIEAPNQQVAMADVEEKHGHSG